jgi:hypothetical protein
MFRFVYYYTKKQQICELEMAIQQATRWLAYKQRWMDSHHFAVYVQIARPENIEAFYQKMREKKAVLNTDKCTLHTLKKELYDSYKYSTLRRRQQLHD